MLSRNMPAYYYGLGAVGDASQVVSVNGPASAKIGDYVTVALSFKNTGTTTWDPNQAYILGRVTTSDRFPLNVPTVAPGSQATIQVSYKFDGNPVAFQMLQEGVEWFGEVANVDIAVQPSATVQSTTVVNPSPTTQTQAATGTTQSGDTTGTSSTTLTSLTNMMQGNVAGIPIWILLVGGVGLMLVMGSGKRGRF